MDSHSEEPIRTGDEESTATFSGGFQGAGRTALVCPCDRLAAGRQR